MEISKTEIVLLRAILILLLRHVRLCEFDGDEDDTNPTFVVAMMIRKQNVPIYIWTCGLTISVISAPSFNSMNVAKTFNGSCILDISDMLTNFRLSCSGVRIMARNPRLRVNHLFWI